MAPFGFTMMTMWPMEPLVAVTPITPLGKCALRFALLLTLASPALANGASSGGSGFFFGGHGRLLTAAHVVAACGSISVVPQGASAHRAEVAMLDPVRDVAVLLVAGADFPDPGLADEVAVGGSLTAFGYPGAASSARLHALPLVAVELPIPRPPDRMPLRGAVAEPGMSGAPLLDPGGRVAGMLLGRGDAAAADAAALARRVGYPVDEIAIALPAIWLARAQAAADPPRRGPVTVARVLCGPR